MDMPRLAVGVWTHDEAVFLSVSPPLTSGCVGQVVMRDEWRYPNGGEIRYLDASCLVYDADGR